MFTPNSILNTRSSRIRKSPTKRARTQVVLDIAANGRAQAKAAIVHEPHATRDGNVSSGYDSFEESDSSLDGDEPRGMAPDGGAYLAYRRQRRRTISGSSFGSDTVHHSFRSTDSMHHSFGSTSSTQLFKTPKKPHRSFSAMDPPSSRLPTPLKSSPPLPPLARPSSSSSSRRLPPVEDPDEDASEAETVVDEQPSPLPRRGLSPPTDDADGDALTALKKVLAGRRRAGSSPPVRTRAFARPSSSAVNSRTFGPSRYQNQNQPPPSMRTPKRKPRHHHHHHHHQADGGYHYKENVGNSSPTTITDPDCDTDEAGETRCICGRKDDGGMTMVECDSCKYWLHVKCLGYGRKALPKVFVCSYCIQVTPQMKRTRM